MVSKGVLGFHVYFILILQTHAHTTKYTTLPLKQTRRKMKSNIDTKADRHVDRHIDGYTDRETHRQRAR